MPTEDVQPRFVEQEGPGHFICADMCRWHKHHHVGPYCVTSVGEYVPKRSQHMIDGGYPEYDGVQLHEVGCGRLYETMVFPLTDEGETAEWVELDSGAYNDRDSAEAGHAEMCERVAKWSRWERDRTTGRVAVKELQDA